jgi:hypothetical protein
VVLEPVRDLLGSGPKRQEPREDLPGALGEESVVAAVIWKERLGEREGLGRILNLVAE